MSFKDCIENAVENKSLRRETADEAKRLFDEIEMDLKNRMNATQAQIEASRRSYEILKADKIEKRRRELLQLKTWQSINKNIQTYKRGNGEGSVTDAILAHFDRDDFARYSNLEGRRKAILGRLHSKMDSVLAKHRRNVIGNSRDKAGLRELVREAFGEDTGNLSAKELAEAWKSTAEFARKRFNAAGGHIGKREDWGLPQSHNSIAVRKQGYSAWRDYIIPKLDLEKMKDNRTGEPFKRENLELVLKDVYETISSEGLNKLRPNGQAVGKSLANRKADHRFLVFKSADDWLDYNRDFGGGDVFSVMMGHLDRMARDISSLEILGPNPNATIRYMEQVMDKSRIGDPSKTLDKVNRAKRLMNNMWSYFNGSMNAPVDGAKARFFAGTRQVLQSAQLGAAAISAITDVNFQRMARKMSGLRKSSIIGQYTKLFRPGNIEDKKLAVRMGLIAENWSQMAAAQARYVGDISGTEFTQRLANFVMDVSLLSPWTQSGKWAFGMEFTGFLADQSAKSFDELSPALKQTLERYNITADEWSVIRTTKPYEYEGATFLRAEDIANRTDILPARADELANKVLEMILTETEFAVPSSSLKARAQLLQGTNPGTISGEFLRSFAMYKNFPVTLIYTHLSRIAHSKGFANKAKWAADMAISTTIMGAFALQAKEISKGRDPRPIDDPKFWGAALMQGGGLGIFGDFLFSNLNRFGSGIYQTIGGPVVGLADDVRELTFGNAVQALQGEDTNAGSEAVRFLKRYTPGSSLWYTRLITERYLFDSIQELADPKAKKKFLKENRRVQRDYGQKYWWAPGKKKPSRSPDLENAKGGL